MKRTLLVTALLVSASLVLAGFGGPANFGREGAGFGRPSVKGGGTNACGNCLLVNTGSFMLVNTGVRLLIQ